MKRRVIVFSEFDFEIIKNKKKKYFKFNLLSLSLIIAYFR